MKKKGTFTKSIGFQIFLYILFGLGVLAGSVCLWHMIWLWDYGVYYGKQFTEFNRQVLQREIDRCGFLSEPIDHIYYGYLSKEYITKELDDWKDSYNVGYVITRESGEGELLETIFSNADTKLQASPYVYDRVCSRRNDGEEELYRVTLYVDPEFPKYDMLHYANTQSRIAYQNRYAMIWAAAAGGLLSLLCAIWILKNAGCRRGREGIAPGWLSRVPMEFLLGVWSVGIAVTEEALEPSVHLWDYSGDVIVVSLFITLLAVWSMLFWREAVLRIKLKCFWRTTLVGMILRLVRNLGKRMAKATLGMLKGLPAALPVSLGLIILTLAEMLAILRWGMRYGIGVELFFLWVFEKIIITPVIIYCMLAFHRLQKGSRALAAGRLTEKLNTDSLILDFKEHGENLNQIGEGMSKAVEERLQSERLKTELITNVSHDLKTPLTSVINYASLLGTEAAAAAPDSERDERLREYSEVLLRQAERLKKLLDDLVEASKATTGNLEVEMVPCELGVMLTQAAGEYEEKFEERHLKLKIVKPDEEVRILADGRHLWRIFDNLLNNICKYAQENSRVYLNMELHEEGQGRDVEIIFRNISKYELNISPQELEERFVRGDSSRHMEGSGLGLSIAKSLTELQNGTLKIVTDGDLFKVILVFPFL